MAEITFDSDTHIKDLEEASSSTTRSSDSLKATVSNVSKNPKSVVVRISKEKLEKSSTSTSKSDEKAKSKSSSSSTSKSNSQSSSSVSTQKKKELLKKAQEAKDKLLKEKQNAKSKSEGSEKSKDIPAVPEPHPVPENFNIPRVVRKEPSPPRDNSTATNREDRRSSPRRSRSPSRHSTRREDRGSPRRRRSRSPRRSHSRSGSRRRSRSPFYRRRRSPSRSRSREFRPYFSRSPRHRSPSPYFRRRSPPHVYRPRSRSRSPVRYGPPRWSRGEDRFPPRDEVFARGPPPRPEFNRPWDHGQQGHPPGFTPNYSRGQSEFQGFSEHSEQWGGSAGLPPSSQNTQPSTQVPGNQLLSIPAEMMIPNPSQSVIDSLKEEIRGLSQSMLTITSQMGNSTKTSANTDRVSQPIAEKSVTSNVIDNTVVQTVAAPSSETVSTERLVSKTVYQPQTEVDDMDASSESGEGESSDGDSSSEESGDESDCSIAVETPEGFLEWTAINRLIVEKFSDRISPEESPNPVARIDNLGGLSEKKETERIRLPMFYEIRKELNLLSKDVIAPPSKAKARRDTKPLGRGVFPEAQRGLPVQALSEDLRFNQPSQIDSGIERLLPPKKSSFNIQGRFSDENLRKMERDLRVNLSCLSYALWAIDYSSQSISQLKVKSSSKDAQLACVSALKHSMSFLTSVVDRSSTALVTSILARRDSFLSQMDPLLTEEDQIMLRASSFLDTSLFAGNVTDLIPKLEELRRDSRSRESVDVLTSLAKKGVEGSSKKSGQGNSYSKKKSSKKGSKKKGSKKSNTSSGTVTTTSDQPASGGFQRTFRNKGGKKSSKK